MKSFKGEYKLVEKRTSKTSGKDYWLIQLGKAEGTKFVIFDFTMISELKEGDNIEVTTDDQNNIALKLEAIGSDLVVKEESIEDFKTNITNKDMTPEKPKAIREGKIKKEYVIDIKGKDFVAFNGVLDVAHQDGLTHLTIVEKEITKDSAWCVARAEFKDGRVFEAIGSSTPANSAGNVGGKYPAELAQTRAYGRVLRIALNLDVTMREELDE